MRLRGGSVVRRRGRRHVHAFARAGCASTVGDGHEAAERHDQSVKVACAASLGFYDVTGDDTPEFLHSVSDAILPPDFTRAYDQIRLDAKVGGHGLRAWCV
jgi:hypothetical protein